MPDASPTQSFGCPHCWPESPEAAQTVRQSLSHVADLVDESHFHAMVLVCPHCSQRFVSVFTETVDWADGEDPQYWTTLPLTGTEAETLLKKKDDVSEDTLEMLGVGRKSLRRDYAKGEQPRVYWGIGLIIGPHD